MRRPGRLDLVRAIQELGIADDRLIEAFRIIRRADFVPPRLAAMAYEDRPLPIPHDQVTTQPSLSARMIEALELSPESSVLEVGTGYGFQTALIATLAARVHSIERWPDLAEVARANLKRCGITNVEVRVGDGSLGMPDAAPFDAILVSAAFVGVPLPLVAQLSEGGRLVQPIGRGGDEMVILFRKRGGGLERVRMVVPAHFVRLIGAEAFPE
jgi:protein-L-isoaspartate(D-aspartate) O-methyltransferase